MVKLDSGAKILLKNIHLQLVTSREDENVQTLWSKLVIETIMV